MSDGPFLRHVRFATWQVFSVFAICTSATAGAQAAAPVFLNINPSWSPNGRQLVFESARHGNTTLYIINVDGTGERRLTTTRYGDDTPPQWSPDGQTILFDSDRDGDDEVYVMDADGRNVR